MIDSDYLLKICITGNSSVGKSNILLRYTDNIFNESFLPTIGVDFKVKRIEVNNLTVKLNLWDTAGQERFKTITSAYYKGCNGIMLVYDITDHASFENIENWLDKVKVNCPPEVVTMLVGNKCDLESERQVSREEAEAYAKSHGMLFVETSAKSFVNIEESFIQLTKSIIPKMAKTKKEDAPGMDLLPKKKDGDKKKKKKCC